MEALRDILSEPKAGIARLVPFLESSLYVSERSV